MSGFLFGTVGSPNATPPKPGGSVGAIQTISSLGLSALELGWVQSVRVTEQTCALIKKEAERLSIALSVHAPYFINLNAEQDEWPKSRKRLMDAAYYGNLAGATDIVFHPGSYFQKNPEEVLPLAIKRLAGCVDELKKAQIPVTLRPETMGKSAMLGSLDDTLMMAKSVDQVLPCIDFAHLHARPGDGSNNSEDEWKKILAHYGESLGEKHLQHLHIHLSGIEYTSKREKNHLPLRESDLNLVALFRALKSAGAGGRIMCESPIMEEDALYMKNTWESL